MNKKKICCSDDMYLRSAAFEQFPDALFIFDREKRVVDMNAAAAGIFGFGSGGIKGKYCNEIFHCECGGHHCPLNGVVKESYGRRGGEHMFMNRNGAVARYYLDVHPLKGKNDEIIGGIVTSRKVEEMEGLNRELIEQAMTDPLTGIGNRRKLYEIMEIEISRAKRHKRPISVLMIDIDHFKDYNDTYGHPAGDDALKYIAGLLSMEMRKEDLTTRFGGEEFVALLPETDAGGALTQAERLRSLVEKNTASGPSLKSALRVSIGVATCVANDSCEASTMISEADKALYKAKRNGRNRVVHFNSV